jgi:hypothetical protein
MNDVGEDTSAFYKMSAQLSEDIATVGGLRDQAIELLTPQSSIRLPKGLRVIAHNLSDITYVLVATKALVDLFIEIGSEQLFQTIKESKLNITNTNTRRILQVYIPSLQKGLDDIKKMMVDDYDRPSANLRARIVKEQTYVLRSFVEQQAKSFVDTIDLFPIEEGSLQLLCLMAKKGDETITHSIDNTMRIADTPLVLVTDAPSMLEAVRRNDEATICRLQKNMIEARMNP